jgi:hypothetical protein
MPKCIPIPIIAASFEAYKRPSPECHGHNKHFASQRSNPSGLSASRCTTPLAFIPSTPWHSSSPLAVADAQQVFLVVFLRTFRRSPPVPPPPSRSWSHEPWSCRTLSRLPARAVSVPETWRLQSTFSAIRTAAGGHMLFAWVFAEGAEVKVIHA